MKHHDTMGDRFKALIAYDPLAGLRHKHRADGGRINLASHIEDQVKSVDTKPTDGQKEAGNYRKGHVKIHGLDISIENPRGSWRTGGIGTNKWRSRLPHHYGYIRKTEGGDGDHVDVYLGPHLKSSHVYVVDQHHLDSTKDFDEHKCFIGFGSETQAREAYHRAFSDGRGKDRIGHIEPMTIDGFKDWLKNSDTTAPIKHRAHGGKVAAEKALPPNHQLGMRVPKGGSMCARCKFLASPTTCGNMGFVEWNGRPMLPAPADEYCCDLYEISKKRAAGGSVSMAEGGDPSSAIRWDDTPATAEAAPVDNTGIKWDDSADSPSGGITSYLPKAVTDIPHEIYQAGSEAVSGVGDAWHDIQGRHAAQAQKDAGPEGSFLDPAAAMGSLKDVADTGKAVVSAASLPAAPLVGAARSAIGHPLAEAEHIVGGIINPKVAAQDNPDQMYQNAKGDVDLAMSAAGAKKAPLVPAVPVPLKNIPTPTTKELFKAADNNYSNMHGYGVEVHPQVTAQVADNIFNGLHTDGYRDYLVPKTFRAVEELKNPIGANSTTQDIEGVRRALNKAAADPAERDAARKAIAEIDGAMSSLQPQHVAVNPQFADRVGQEAAEARANYAAAKRSEMLDEIGKKASRQANAAGSGTGIDNATRQRIKSVLDNPKKLRGFSDDEKDQMEQIVKGTFTGNAARLLGKFAPSGVVSGALSAGAGFAAHGPLGAIAVPTAGYIAKKIGDASTAAQSTKLSRLVRARSPLGKKAAINAAAQSVFAQPTNRALLPAAGVSAANLQLPYRGVNLGPLQGPVPSYAGDKQQ